MTSWIVVHSSETVLWIFCQTSNKENFFNIDEILITFFRVAGTDMMMTMIMMMVKNIKSLQMKIHYAEKYFKNCQHPTTVKKN